MKDKIWITSALKKSSRTKNKLYKKWLITRLPKDEEKYKNYKKVFKKLTGEAERMYYNSMFNTRTNSIKQIWRNLNIVCSLKDNKSKKQTITKLRTSNCYVTNPLDISNEMNNHFVTIGEKLVETLVRNNPTISNDDYKRYLKATVKESLFISPVTKNELLLLIQNLNSNKSSGPDNIAPDLIKIAAPALVEPLMHIYNRSLMTGIVPDKLKIAKVTPVFKKGDHCIASNYRPISLLSIFDKLLEKLMYTRLYSFLTKNNVLYKYQFGF